MSELGERRWGTGQTYETIHTDIPIPPPVPMLDIPSGVHQDSPQPPDAPDTGAVTEAYAHLAVAMYQSSMGYADCPAQVHHAYGVLERELRRLDALPTCDPFTLVPVRPMRYEPPHGDE